uniref:Uncharacterized protein n=1 Tax=Aureoumbra lagunensis TaxID=44058 RepID=A0A7S3K580_9STRA
MVVDDENKEERSGGETPSGPGLTSSRRPPPEESWRQQAIPSFRPLITRDVVMLSFFVFGVISLAVGWILKSVADEQVFQKKVQYGGSGSGSTECNIDSANEGRVCNVTIKANHRMNSPVYVYYELENFYQNHQRYLGSLDSDQLLGENKKKGDLSSCSPLKKNGSKVLSPCGLIANSMFNDVITLKNDDLDMRENKIAWRSDKKKKFKQPKHFDWAFTNDDISNCILSTCPDYICEDAGVHTGCKGYICNGGDFDDGKCAKGQSTVFYYRKSDYYQFLYQTFPDIISPLVGVKNEHFIVWMRLGGLSDFRKLYGRITDTVHEGTELVFQIVNNFQVDSFDGKKYLIVSTTSTLGANLSALWTAWLAFGASSTTLALAIFIKTRFAPRQLGDTSFLLSLSD